MDEVAAAREVSACLRTAADDVRSQRIAPHDLAVELIGLAERVDWLSAELQRRSTEARRPSARDLDAPDSGLVSESLSLLDDFRLIPRRELRRSVLALVHALRPAEHRPARRSPARD